MKTEEKSVLHYAYELVPGCWYHRYYIHAVEAYLDSVDMSIVRYLAMGQDRDDIAELLCRTRRAVERRLERMRALFNCKNTTHLMATLAVTPMDNSGCIYLHIS